MKTFRHGLTTGFVLQLAMGPVFFFIINLVLQRTVIDGFFGVIAVTLVDYLYITLAIFGVGKLLENNKNKKIFGIASSMVLVFFGVFIIKDVIVGNISTSIDINSVSLFSSFISVFFLAVSSPMTIVFFTGLFIAKTIEYNYTKKELFVFGFGTGLATLLFMGTSVIIFSIIKEIVPTLLIQVLNLIVGCLLVVYGGIRLVKK